MKKRVKTFVGAALLTFVLVGAFWIGFDLMSQPAAMETLQPAADQLLSVQP